MNHNSSIFVTTLCTALAWLSTSTTGATDSPVFKSQQFEQGTLIYSDEFDGEYNRERWGAPKKDRQIKDGKLIVTARFQSKEEAMKALKRDHHLGLEPVVHLNRIPEAFVCHMRFRFETDKLTPGRPVLQIGHHMITFNYTKALRGEEMARGPMFTHVPGHGGTPHWLPPSTSVHHGDWKLIRTYHYGDNGKHEYRLYNLRDDIGESRNLAEARPQKVKELDKLIEDYIAEAKVVVPLPNPKFDPTRFDPTRIGVQPGGLKMPRTFLTTQPKRNGGKPAKVVSDKSMLGWIARGVEATVEGDSLRIRPVGRQSFIANAKVRASGPVEVGLRIRAQQDGTGRLQWRTEGQDTFPKNQQSKSFEIAGGGWQELSVPLGNEGRVVHLRLFMSSAKQSTEIDWIEVRSKNDESKSPQRWDFKQAKPPKGAE